ncbi:HTH-type transcriptional regulator GlpR [Halomicroarcula sp. GCM10025709]|uniref:HTH-type transcriptional regulator GlpR n=1 Tax=Haloarcula TaxID=2237 RepID=UPI0024C44BD3|nr:HTH-type transcriptional regulator GlpR [Halomicroarcula sp. YJ-61-S]
MLPEERKQEIVGYVERQDGASVSELADELRVSESTIRRDLTELNQDGLVRRSHGGALPAAHVASEPSFAQRSVQNLDAKRLIAERAVKEITDGDVVFFDSGTTVLEVAKAAPKDGSFTAVTNSIELGFELGTGDGRLKVTGGNQRNKSRSLVGPVGERFLRSHHFDLLFLGTNSIDLDAGLSTPNEPEGRMKQLMVDQSERVVLLADGSKFGRRSYVQFAPLTAIDTLVTEARLADERRRALRDRSIEVVDALA